MDAEAMREVLDRHKAEPHVTVTEYVEGLTAQLCKSIEGKRRIYLDTRYWVILRDAAMGRPRTPEHTEILTLLRNAVSSGKAFCPISDVALMETLKQSDLTTRFATASLMDELGLGVALQDEQTRIRTELEHFLNYPLIDETTPPLKHLVWTKAAYVLGISLPTSELLTPEQNRLIQKATVDYCWQATLRQHLGDTAGVPPPSDEGMVMTAAKITVDMRTYDHQVKSMKQAFLAEIAGVLRVFSEDIGTLLLRMYRRQFGHSAVSPEELKRVQGGMTTMLYNMFRLKANIMAQRAPSMYVHAMCHAAIRMDRTRKMSSNDLLDIHHASAVGHHDAVFTEKPLQHLLTGGNMAIDKRFNCTILWKERSLIEYLKALNSPEV